MKMITLFSRGSFGRLRVSTLRGIDLQLPCSFRVSDRPEIDRRFACTRPSGDLDLCFTPFLYQQEVTNFLRDNWSSKAQSNFFKKFCELSNYLKHLFDMSAFKCLAWAGVKGFSYFYILRRTYKILEIKRRKLINSHVDVRIYIAKLRYQVPN